MKHSLPRLSALPLLLALVACSPDPATPPPTQAQAADAAEVAATGTAARGHSANEPDAAPSPPGREPVPSLSDTLAAHHWRLDSATAAGGTAITALSGDAGAPLQLAFAQGRVTATNACNTLVADFTLDARALVVGPMTGTERACAEPLMAMEREAQTRLTGDHELEFEDGQPPRLRLQNRHGDTLVFSGVRAAPPRPAAARPAD